MVQEFLKRIACSEIVEKGADWHAGADENGRTADDFGIGVDDLLQVHDVAASISRSAPGPAKEVGEASRLQGGDGEVAVIAAEGPHARAGQRTSGVVIRVPDDLSAPDGITRHIAPGTRVASGKYPVATGLEHDELGHPTGSGKLHTQMNAKRRNKLRKLATEIPVPKIYGASEGHVLLVGWGSSKGPIEEAVKLGRQQGEAVSSLHIKYINPLPNDLEKLFSGFTHVVVAEINDEGLYGHGQLASLLRSRYCDPRIQSVTKTDGLPWKVKEILNRALVLTK